MPTKTGFRQKFFESFQMFVHVKLYLAKHCFVCFVNLIALDVLLHCPRLLFS